MALDTATAGDEALRRQGVCEQTRLICAAGTLGIFVVQEYAGSLDKVMARKGIETHYQCGLVELRADAREAVFIGRGNDEQVVIGYDLKPQESLPFDRTKERWSMYQSKRHLLPVLYWKGILKVRA